MSARHIQILTVEAGRHDEIVSSLCAQKLAPEFAIKKAVMACHKMANVMDGPRHVMLFEVAGVSPAGAGPDQSVVLVDLSTLIDLGDAVQMRTLYGQRIWPA